ncbi:atp-dependent rna helicase, partial [Perkinsus olseni]
DELEIDEEDAKKPAVFGLDAVGSVATSILRAEGAKPGGETKEEEDEEDPLDKYMQELTAKTGVTVGGGAAAAAAAAGLSVMDAAMQNNTINLDDIDELTKAEQGKAKEGDGDAEGEKVAVKEEGVVEDDEDEDDDAYYEAFRKAMKESQKESGNVKQIFAPV